MHQKVPSFTVAITVQGSSTAMDTTSILLCIPDPSEAVAALDMAAEAGAVVAAAAVIDLIADL